MAILRDKLRPVSAGCYVALACYLVLAASLAYGQTKNSCLDCHSALPDPLGVSQEKFSQDIHAQMGLTCASCHEMCIRDSIKGCDGACVHAEGSLAGAGG